MEILKIILIGAAYTVSIASLLLQFLCYRKKIEYKETILFSFSMLLLIVSVTIIEIYTISGRVPEAEWEIAFYMIYLVIGITTPVNIHTERMVKQVTIKNLLLLIMGGLLAIVLVSGYFFNYFIEAEVAVLVFMNASILYSMLVIIKSKPSLLVLHREKIERRTAKIFMILLPVMALLFISDHFLDFYKGPRIDDGSIVISIIVFGLALSKLLDDIKRLSLFRPDNKYDEKTLSFYGITDRELEVVNLLVKGKSYKEISEVLFISLPTVKTHVTNIYGKMEINNKVELINLLNR